MLTPDPDRTEVTWEAPPGNLVLPDGVLPERFHAYLIAKAIAPRGALAGDLLPLAAFLLGIDKDAEPDPAEDAGNDGEAEDDRDDDETAVEVDTDDEDDETPGFADPEGRDDWPPTQGRKTAKNTPRFLASQ